MSHTYTVARWVGTNASLLSLNIGQALLAVSALCLTHTVLNGDEVDGPFSVNECQEALYIKIHVRLFFLLFLSSRSNALVSQGAATVAPLWFSQTLLFV